MSVRVEDLVFESVSRPGFAGEVWDVRHDGRHVATVAERAVSVPPFLVAWPSGETERLNDRDAVVAALVRGEP
ncbi:hypothetical protein Mx8p34 [Myxococcus phage Mx8]|uniref:p34 n=1 Tax=Myxococcus phage Mx8 TaxID=49964 RepID=Q94MT5_9CAUD|nr:hypothetical protein Mx8p34 [Myxococcus phage Mx8]AAK94369.1 p34 [Myxococcus phage Mx8]